MKGKYFINIKDVNVEYYIPLDRKITIIKGKSATGKSTLVDMLSIWLNSGKRTGIRCNSNAEIIVLNNLYDWETNFKSLNGKIFVADENVEYISWQSFGEAVNNSENYFLFITRSGMLGNLTYATYSILELRSEKKDNYWFTTTYSKYMNCNVKVKPDLIITEDSKSGYEMMNIISSNRAISAGGKDKVIDSLEESIDDYNNIVIFVDHAAFGSCIGAFNDYFDDITILYVESFEWLLLNLNMLKKYVIDELEHTENYCDFKGDIISYERYFTMLLNTTMLNHLRCVYKKNKLNEIFMNKSIYGQIKGLLSDIDWD